MFHFTVEDLHVDINEEFRKACWYDLPQCFVSCAPAGTV